MRSLLFSFCILAGLTLLGCGSDDSFQSDRFNPGVSSNTNPNATVVGTATANGSTFLLAVLSNNTNANLAPFASSGTATVTGVRTPNAANFDRLDVTMVVTDPSTNETRTLVVVLDKGAQGPVLAGDVFVVGSTLQVPGAAGTYTEVVPGAANKTGQTQMRSFVSLSGSIRVLAVSPSGVALRLNPMVFTPTNVSGNSAEGDFTFVGDIQTFF